MGMCEWTDCPDKPMLHTRSAYSPSNILLTLSGPDTATAGRSYAYASLGSAQVLLTVSDY